MGLLTFKGGLHPYDGKELSKDKPITEYLPQEAGIPFKSAHWCSCRCLCKER